MKTFTRLLAGAALFASAAASYAAPLYNKLSGTDFDLYYESSAFYTPTLTGNALGLVFNSLNAAIDQDFELGMSPATTMFLVAHDGKLLKSDYSQQFSGSMAMGPQNFGRGSLSFGLFSNLYSGTFDGESISLEDSLAGATTYVSFHAQNYFYYQPIDSANFEQLGTYFERGHWDNGQEYKRMALDLTAQLHMSGASPNSPIMGQLDRAAFTFQAIDDPSSGNPADPADVPEPASLALMALGVAALTHRRRRP